MKLNYNFVRELLTTELMNDFLILETCMLKIFITAKLIFSKPMTALMALPIIISLTSLSTTSQALLLLLGAFILDFITGVYASYIETKRKSEKRKSKSFWGKILDNIYILGRTISSEKLRKSVVKGLTYSLFILSSYLIQSIFFIKSFQFSNISHREFTVTIVVIGFCILTELWSVFKENLPRAGYDLGAALMRMVRGVKKIKKEVEE